MACQCRNWCGTLQVQEGFDVPLFFNGLISEKKVRFVIGQLERGSHLHVQYYVQRDKRSRLSNMKNEVCDKTHWEPARGTAEQNIQYCTKASTRVAGPWEFGECNTQGKRNDIERATEMIDEGKSLREVAIECKMTFVKFHKGLKAYEAITKSRGPRLFGPEGPEVWVFWGPTGVGKSRRAHEEWPDAYRKMTNDKWWDGYKGEETVIFDDFKGSSMKLHDFQTIIDRYPIQVEVKGAVIDLSATRYVFTSNKHPSEWYSQEADPDGTVMRRIRDFCESYGRLIHMVWPQPPQSMIDAWEAGPFV
jgi:hypothetical protein